MKKLMLLCIAFYSSLYALNIDRVILSTDTNPEYVEFWPIVAKAWRDMGIKPTLAFIADKNIEIDESLGDVIRFEPIEGIPTSFQAQVIRLLLPTYFENEGCLLSDIDMIPLHKDYFVNSIKDIAQNCFVIYRDKAYTGNVLSISSFKQTFFNAYNPKNVSPEQYPICYIAAQGKTFKELFNAHNVVISTVIRDWYTLSWGWFTDEHMVYQTINDWKDKEKRCIKLGHGVERRIDRYYWLYDQALVKQNFYIDAHCPRPYSKYKNMIDELITIKNTPSVSSDVHIYNNYITAQPIQLQIFRNDGSHITKMDIHPCDDPGYSYLRIYPQENSFLRIQQPEDVMVISDDFVRLMQSVMGRSLSKTEINDLKQSVLKYVTPRHLCIVKHTPDILFEITGELKVLQNLIKKDDIVFDIGAHDGKWTQCVLKHALPNRIYVFEPDPEELKKCQQNISHSSVLFHDIMLSQNKDTSLDEFCVKQDVSHINFIKIDAHGFELNALKGASNLLHNNNIDFIQFKYGPIYRNYRATLKDIFDFLTSYGYCLFKLYEHGIIQVKEWENCFENYYQSNFLAISKHIMD